MVAMNCLITPKGDLHLTGGTQHNIYIRRRSGLTLKTFLELGGVRVKVHGEHIAIEAGRPLTTTQKRHVRRILKEHDFYSLVMSIGGAYGKLERFRPIRSI